MKIAYITRASHGLPGVLKKIETQVTTWKKLGNSTATFFISSDHKISAAFRPWEHANLLNPYRALIRSVETFRPDVVYVRSIPTGGLAISLLLHFRDRLILEINSFAAHERALFCPPSSWLRLKSHMTNILQPMVIAEAAGLSCVTQEISESAFFLKQRNRLVAPNGIDITKYPPIKCKNTNGRIKLFFIGTPNQPWHGVDKLITLAQRLGNLFEIHIVGPNTNDLCLQKVPKPLPSNIIFHGFLQQGEYIDILRKSHICIGSAALHRIQMFEACPLKSREYIASGFPIITPYKDTAFLGNTPEWVLDIPNSSMTFEHSEIIDKIKNFCLANKNRIVPHAESKPYIDIQQVEEKKLIEIKKWLKHTS